MISESAAPWIAILLAAAVTYSLRISGLLLSEKLPRTGPVRRFLDALPATLLLSLVAPALVRSGTVGFLAATVVVGVTRKTENAFIAMLAGTFIVAGLRFFPV